MANTKSAGILLAGFAHIKMDGKDSQAFYV